jgi:hypothetical protein
VLSYCISKAICVYTMSANICNCTEYTILWRDFSSSPGRLLNVRVLRKMIYITGSAICLYVSVFIVSFILYI